MAKNPTDLIPTAPDAGTLPDLKGVGALALNEALSERLDTEVRTYDARWATYAQEGVLVEVHLKRERFKLQLTLRDIGIEPRDKKEADQLNSIVAPGHRFLLPREIAVKRPESIESEARETLKRYSFKTYWGRWVHVNSFAQWSAANEVVKGKYLRLVDDIEANYDQLVNDALVAWLGLCQKTYGQLARTAASKRIPDFEDREKWLAVQAAAFLAKVPTMERIRSRFEYEWDVFSLPSLVQQVKDESAQARWQRMSDAERAMQRQLEQTAQRKLQGGVDQFLSEIRGQIQAEVLQVASSALAVVQGRGGKLERNSSKALGDLIAQWRAMVFWDDDQAIESKLTELERVLATDFKKRDPQVTTSILQTLAAEARLALNELDVPLDRTAVNVGEAIEKADAAGVFGDVEALEVMAGRVVAEYVGDDDLFEDEDDAAPPVARQASDPDDLVFDLDEDAAPLARQPISAD